MSPSWFRKGSKVIITTRNERLLNVYEAIAYKLEKLDEANALKLFCLKAFHSNSPLEGYIELSSQFIDHVQGLPLALEVLGSSLYKRSISEWQSVLSELGKIPIEKVTSRLRISYDALDEIAKKVFLYIACFFKGQSKCRVLFILSSCYGFNLDHIINLLKERSLVIESDGELRMHDLIQKMGRKVVRQDSPSDPGRCSLLWHSEDIYNVLEHNMGTELVEGIVLTSPMTTFKSLSAKAFSQMTKLRLLILCDVSLCGSLDYLSNNLRFLEWQGFPFEYLPTSFEAKDLVELNLPNSHVKELWHGTKYFMHLETIELSHSKSLFKTPDFTGAPNLKKIILEGCLRLQEVDKSIGILEKLTLLNLKDCEQLEVLPDNICDLRSLRFLNLSGCSSLLALPRNLGSLKCLEELKVTGMGTKRSSASWWSLFSFFTLLSSRNSRSLSMPPLSGLVSLKELELSFCNISDGNFLDDICQLFLLEELNLSGNLFSELSPCFTQLTKLKRVYLNHCQELRCLPTLPSSVNQVYADECPYLESLPNQLTVYDSGFARLSFNNCINLVRKCGSSDLAKVLLENYYGTLKHNGTGTNETFDICIPGNSIPMWISNQRSGSVVSIDLLDAGFQGTRSGFVACCVFENCEHQNAGMGDHPDDGVHRCYVHCGVAIDEEIHEVEFYTPLFAKRFQAGSSNIWLLHVFPEHRSVKIPLGSKRVTFSFMGRHPGCVVIKSCGAALTFPFEQEAKPRGGCEIRELD